MSSILARTVLLLVASNVFMTFAWYAHLKNLNDKPWYLAAVFSWDIALFEYLLQVPANRIGFAALDLPRLKILQEVITLAVFIPFSVWYMQQPLLVHAAAAEVGLPLGGPLSRGRRLFHVPVRLNMKRAWSVHQALSGE